MEWSCGNGKYTVCLYLTVFIQVQNNEADLGVPSFGCSHARSTVIICSAPTLHTYKNWYSKAPGPMSPATNLLRIFTPDVWLFILLSIQLFCGFLYFAATIGNSIGINTTSYEDFLVPLRYLYLICSLYSFLFN